MRVALRHQRPRSPGRLSPVLQHVTAGARRRFDETRLAIVTLMLLTPLLPDREKHRRATPCRDSQNRLPAALALHSVHQLEYARFLIFNLTRYVVPGHTVRPFASQRCLGVRAAPSADRRTRRRRALRRASIEAPRADARCHCAQLAAKGMNHATCGRETRINSWR